MKRIVLFLALLAVSAGTFAKDNFKFSGRIDGVTTDTLLIEYVQFTPKKNISNFKVPIKDGQFSFSARLNETCNASLRLKSNPRNEHTTYFAPNEEAVFSGRLNLFEEHWDGSEFYQQYQHTRDLIRPFYEENKATKSLPDSIHKMKKREITDRMHAAVKEYIKQHANEDATAVLTFYTGAYNELATINALAPEVRNGRCKPLLDKEVEFLTRLNKEITAHNAVGSDTVKIGSQVPELGMKDLDGLELQFSSLRGRYVVLDFWGSWCTWCIKGFPKLKKYYEKYSDRLEIVGIDCNDTDEKWRAAVKKHKLPWLQVRSADGIAEMKFRIKGYPYKVLISPEGVVLKTFVGETDDFYTLLDDLLSE